METSSADRVLSESPNEYLTLRDEILRADDQAVQLLGFAIVAATLVATTAATAARLSTQLLLLTGFNFVVLVLTMKVHEKRGQQGRIAAYLRVFHERGRGWETRVQLIRELGGGEPGFERTNREQASLRRFHHLAALGESFSFATLSLLCFAGTVIALLWSPGTSSSTGQPTRAVAEPASWILGLSTQTVIFVVVIWKSRTFRHLARSSKSAETEWRALESIEHATLPTIVVNGPPASGKTTLATALSRRLEFPLFTKDDLKEEMYDHLETMGGVPVPVTTAWLDSFDDLVTTSLLAVALQHQPCVLESNFRRHQLELFRTRVGPVIEVRCMAARATLETRYKRRSAIRHRVHVQSAPPGHLGTTHAGGHESLGLGDAIVVDTDNLDAEQAVDFVVAEYLTRRFAKAQMPVGSGI